MHRTFQTALLSVAGPWSRQSAAAGSGGTVEVLGPDIYDVVSHVCASLLTLFPLQVVNTVTSNQECVSNIAESLVLSNLLLLLHSLPSSKKTL